MNSEYQDRRRANEIRAEKEYQQRLEELRSRKDHLAMRREREAAAWDEALCRHERSAEVRRKVRELCEPLLDPQRNGGLPIIEVLEGALSWVAGSLDCQELDESAGLKVRRLGRLMADETVLF